MIHFLGIGAQKAATTWLYERLQTHPQVRFPAGKEVHYWDRPGGQPPSTWLERFPDVAAGISQGEITPAYAILPREVVEEIRKVTPPDLRIFYAVRNPVERAWSSALMALQRAELTIEEASDQWFIDHFQSAGSLQRGDYVRCLSNWQSVFGRESIHVIIQDDIRQDPRAVLRTLAAFLGIDGAFYEQMPADVLAARVLDGPGLPLRKSLAGTLHRLYDQKIDDLARILSRDFSHWKSLA